jgi:hypothetical protein
MAATSDGIVIEGLEKTIKALREYDKTALKRFNKVINDELSSAERDSRRIIDFVGNSSGTPAPMRGWVTSFGPSKPTTTSRGGAGWPPWVPGTIKAGIKKTRSQGRVRADFTTSAGSLINKSPAGAIFEVAGRRSSGKGKRGQQFVRNLQQWGKASRLVWRVVDRDRDKIIQKVRQAQEEANQLLQKRLNQSGR